MKTIYGVVPTVRSPAVQETFSVAHNPRIFFCHLSYNIGG